MKKHSNITEDLKEKIKEALENRFDEIQKQRIDEYSTRFNFACPFCGDSESNVNAKRGNIWYETQSYKCYNCNIWMPIKDFLLRMKDYGFLSSNISNDLMLDSTIISNSNEYTGNLNFLYSDVEDHVKNYCVSRNELKKLFSLQEIENSKKLKYLQYRGFKKFNNFLWSEHNDKLFILNMHNDTEMVLGYQTRNFNVNAKTKYLTYKLEKIYQELKWTLPPDNDESFKKINDFSGFFNIMNVDISKPITYFEGPIDSFLFKNSVGLSSVHNHPPFETANTRFLFDFDNEGIKKSREYLMEKKTVFLWRLFFKEYPIIEWIDGQKLDFNDLIIQLRDNKIYKVNFNKYFSNNKMDSIWL